jgi:hypothetical protein
MSIRSMKLAVAALALGSALVAVPMVATEAQVTGGGADPRTARADDDGMDFGWVGIFGLAGLAGLLGRRDESRVHRGATATTTR